MRELLEELFPYLIILYLLDGVHWIHTAQVTFISHLRRFKVVQADSFFASFSPLDRIVITANAPVLPTTTGVYYASQRDHENRAEQTMCYVAYGDIHSVEAEHKKVILNGRKVWSAPSHRMATEVMRRIRRLREMEPEERMQAIHSSLKDALEPSALRRRVEAAAEAAGAMRPICALFFLLLFAALPAALYAEWGERIELHGLAIGIGATYGLILAETFYFRRRLYGEKMATTLGELSALLFAPVSAARAHDAVVREVFTPFDPLAVASLLLPAQESRALLRAELYKAHRVVAPDSEPGWAAYWTARAEVIERSIARSGSSVQEIFAPPNPIDPRAAGYCPICHGEYRAGYAVCSECNVSVTLFGSEDEVVLPLVVKRQILAKRENQ